MPIAISSSRLAGSGILQPAVLMAWDLQQYLLSPNPFTKNLELNSLLYSVNDNLMNSIHTEPVQPERVSYQN